MKKIHKQLTKRLHKYSERKNNYLHIQIVKFMLNKFNNVN